MYEKRIAMMQRRRLKPVAKLSSFAEHVKQSRSWLKLLHARRSLSMQEITLQFQDNDTLPDRLRDQTTTQDIIERALCAYMGEFGLKPVPEGFQPKSILELAQARGLFKAVENN